MMTIMSDALLLAARTASACLAIISYAFVIVVAAAFLLVSEGVSCIGYCSDSGVFEILRENLTPPNSTDGE